MVGDWRDEGPCTPACRPDALTASLRRQVREIVQQPTPDGAPCPALERTRACTDAEAPRCPVDCEFSWGAWGPCDPSCRGADEQTSWKERTRAITRFPAFGGKACPPVVQREACSPQEAPRCPVDCVLGEYGPWTGECPTACIPKGSPTPTQRRERPVLVQPQFGGTPCGPTVVTRDCEGVQVCPDPVDCEMEWGEWSACSKPCGGGTRTVSTRVRRPAAHGGQACPAVQTETEPCNEAPCPVNCTMGAWRCLAVAGPDGVTRTCWADAAPASCITGLRVCVRSVATPAAHGGSPCPDEDGEAATMSARNELAGLWAPLAARANVVLGTQSLERLITLALQNYGLRATISGTATVAEQLQQVVAKYALKQVKVEACRPAPSEMRPECQTHPSCSHVRTDADLASAANWKTGLRLPGMCGTAAAPADCTNEQYFLCAKCTTTGTYQPTVAGRVYETRFASASAASTPYATKQQFVADLRNGRAQAAEGPCTTLALPNCACHDLVHRGTRYPGVLEVGRCIRTRSSGSPRTGYKFTQVADVVCPI